MLIIMSQKPENSKKKPSNKGISIMKAIDRFHEAEERKNKGINSTSFANGGNAHGASFVGTSSKKFVTKMKVLKKRPIQSHEYNLEADEDCVTFLELGGCQEIKSEEY